MASTLILAALWLAAAWRTPGLRHGAGRIAPWTVLTALALTLTAGRPPVIRAVDRTAGIADMAVLDRHLSAVIACTAALDWVSALKNPGRPPGFRRHHAAAAAVAAAMTALFAVMPRPESQAQHFAATSARPAATAYLLVFYLYLGTAMAVTTALFLRASRPLPGSSRADRWGLRLLACGTAAATCYAAWLTAVLALRAAGIITPPGPRWAYSVGRGLENLAIALVLAGMTVPALGVAAEGARNTADLRALREIRQLLYVAVPEAAAAPGRRGPACWFCPHLRLTRRVAEIRDAALALSSRVAPDLITAARTRLAARGLAGTALDAATEACWIQLAVRAVWDHAPRTAGGHVMPGRDSLEDEVRWLRAIAARTWTSDVTAVTDELAATTYTRTNWPSVTRPRGPRRFLR